MGIRLQKCQFAKVSGHTYIAAPLKQTCLNILQVVRYDREHVMSKSAVLFTICPIFSLQNVKCHFRIFNVMGIRLQKCQFAKVSGRAYITAPLQQTCLNILQVVRYDFRKH
jgi:hypothetical protein